ncbi:MAG TPA: hypothetical protein PL196_08120, partial [Burkholderiaceae bacterium]|nr:hypothetical protein [Burkholderiaceae bacterium]
TFRSSQSPLEVTPRVLASRNGGSVQNVYTVPDDGADLIGAAATPSFVALVSATAAVRLQEGAVVGSFAAPPGVELLGTAAVGEAALLFTTAGAALLGASGEPRWPVAGSPILLAATTRGDEIVGAGAGFVAGYATAEALLAGERTWSLAAGSPLASDTIRALVANVSLPRSLDVVAIGENGLYAIDVAGAAVKTLEVPEFRAGRVPLGAPAAIPRAAALASDGGFVVATSAGAYRALNRGDGFEWRVYPAERWLPSEDVRAVATAPTQPDGPIWFATAGGLATVTASRMTIEQKLGPFVERIVERHDRDGAVADSHLLRKGDLSSNVKWDSDNDGGWTAYWVLGECYRWKVTGATDARDNFDRAMEGMLRLTEITGTDYFLARSVIRKSTCNLDDCDDPDDGAWYTSADGEWWIKRDTSNDEVISHIYMMGPAYDLCADRSQRARIRDHIAGIVGGIMDHGWQLIDPITNAVTTYGQFDPGYVNSPVGGLFADGGQRAVAILAGLTEAYYMTGEQRFQDGKNDLIQNQGYADKAQAEVDYPLRGGTYSGDGDELSAQAWFALLRYEQDPALRARWLDGWQRHHVHTAQQQGALWDTLNGVVGGEVPPGFANAARWLRTAPVDMIRWNIHNWHRLDLAPPPAFYARIGRQRSDGRILPYDERACERWNTSQYRMNGGIDGMIEMDGEEVIETYWMARYYGFIAPGG